MNNDLLRKVGSIGQDNLFAKLFPPAETFGVTIKAGEGELARGTVLVMGDDGTYTVLNTETTDAGKVKAKTVGKMIDSKLTLEGLFSIVLLCEAGSEGHHFVTQSDGYSTAKSPMDMFPLEMDNDLKLVDTIIREYWGLSPIKT